MSEVSDHSAKFKRHNLVQGRCIHPTGSFMEFGEEEIEQSIHDRFEKQVSMYADRLAIKTRLHEFTYEDLNKAANRITHSILEQRGEGQEAVALVFGHGAPMITAILGVLKAGKFYVPLDPSLPVARTKYIIDDSQAELIITNGNNLSFARELSQSKINLINADELDPGLSDENPGISISPDALTWILHTSGSTGQPKGVTHSHRNVLHFVMNYANGFHICPDDRLSLLYSCSVNAGAHDIFTALLNGCSLYPLDIKTEGLAPLADWLIQNRITIYSSVPTVLFHFLDGLKGDEKFPDLRVMKMMGEPVYKRHIELYKKYLSPDCIFVNRLGSTETGSIRWYFIDKETEITDNNVPIGYPVRDNEILLLDDNEEEVAFGEIGEISVRSRYLSPGYWRKPERTQAAFLPDPEGGEKRIYRTGDLGRMLPDGCLIHLGRKDFQVKVRGHRVEVAEIEAALLDHDGVNEAVVWPIEGRHGEKRLVGYIVPEGLKAPTVTELRRFLAKSLPEYMIPSAFVALDSLPFAPNGKLDRRALPPPGTARPELDVGFIAPRNELEGKLASIWATLLGMDSVGIRDDFLDLGGNSLIASQLFAQIQKIMGRNLPVSFISQASNIEQQANIIRQQETSSPSSLLTAIQPGGSRPPLFFVHGCTGNVLMYEALAQHLGSEQPFYAFKAQGLYGEKKPYTRYVDMADRYIKELRAIQPNGPYLLGGFSVGSWVALEIAQRLLEQGHEVALLVMIDVLYLAHRGEIPDSDFYSAELYSQSRKHPFHRVLKGTIRKYLARCYWKLAYSFISRRSSYIRQRVDYTRHIANLMIQAQATYEPKVYPGRITYFLAEERKDRFASGWYDLARGGLDLHLVAGKHHEMLKEPYVEQIADRLKIFLGNSG